MAIPAGATNGIAPSYPQYANQQSGINGGPRIKTEPGAEPPFNGLPNGYAQQQGVPQQGGLARAQQLVQQYGQTPNAQSRGGLALPGQQNRPPNLQLPGHNQQQAQQQYSQQQHQMLQRQQQQLQQQQGQPRIKVEANSPQIQQAAFQQQQQPQQPNAGFAQTDGADDSLAEWATMLAQRRAVSAEQNRQADRMVRDHVMQLSSDLESGLMVPLDEQRRLSKGKKRRIEAPAVASSSASAPRIPQMDGDLDDDEDEKPDIKDEDDENAINSDLDDTDDEGPGAAADEDDDLGDKILCTYDKVQRVKNKWKCTLKDGVMGVGGREWVFHKGMGEFEW